MKSLPRLFVTGLLSVLPIVVTLAILAWLAGSLEAMLGGLLGWILPDGFYHTGMGLVAGVVVIFALGVMMHTWLAQRLLELFESGLMKVPMVSALYGAVKDMTGMLGSSGEKQFSGVVTFTLPGTSAKLMGFITRDDCSDLPAGLGGEDIVAVYMPMSYQIGGYTLLLPRDALEPVDMPMSDALRFTITAGVKAKAKEPEP